MYTRTLYAFIGGKEARAIGLAQLLQYQLMAARDASFQKPCQEQISPRFESFWVLAYLRKIPENPKLLYVKNAI